MVLAYDLLEVRCTIDFIITNFPSEFINGKSFENLDTILHDWAKDKYKESITEALKRYEKHSLAGTTTTTTFIYTIQLENKYRKQKNKRKSIIIII